jgi:hypothetical protein
MGAQLASSSKLATAPPARSSTKPRAGLGGFAALTSTHTYLNNAGDRLLQTIHHKYPNGNTLSRFDYTYDKGGNIVSWRQQTDDHAVIWKYAYDMADQLVQASETSTDAVPASLKRYVYAYDPAGNRTVEQIDNAVIGATYDAANSLVSQEPTGVLQVLGTTGRGHG